MDLLKKHIEKVALAIALVALIGSGAYFALSVGKLTGSIQNAISSHRPPKPTVQPLNISPYSNALVELTTPFEWAAMQQNPFLGWPTNAFEQSLVDTGKVETGRVQAVFSYIAIEHLPFQLLFRAYSWDPEKQRAYNFQVNFIDQARTFFVAEVGKPIADRYHNTGFRIVNFQRVLTNVTDNVGEREVDMSLLTIQHADDTPIVLPLNKITTQSEPIGVLKIWGESQPRRLRAGQSFESLGQKYNVVDITPKQMLILDTQSKENKPVAVPFNASGPQ
jgi:hypothetical protein